MVVLMALWCTVACTTTDEVPSPDVVQKYVSARLSLSVDANNGGTTRMSAANTQNSGNFLGVRDLWLVPFETAGKITATDTPLDLVTTTAENVTSANGNVKYFFTPNMMRMQIGMASFLAYGRADHDGSSPESHGSLTASYTASNDFTPANVTFKPVSIPTNADDATKAARIAQYLTSIATAGPENGKWYQADASTSYFNNFANIHNGIPERFAGSSTNILKHVNETYKTVSEHMAEGDLKTAVLNAIKNTQYVTFADGKVTALEGSAEGGLDLTGYPATLPDGVAGMLWNGTAFESKPGNDFDRYVYPAELYYYANSRIFTSAEDKQNSYQATEAWADFISREFENQGADGEGATVESDTRSIALVQPLQYGVSCLEVQLRAGNNKLYAFNDNYNEPSIQLAEGMFPLKGILVGGQHIQQFDFTPKYPEETTEATVPEDKEYIIYDKSIASEGVCLGNFIKGATADNFSKSLYTLTLQTKQDKSVKLVLEFENNSNNAFTCASGIIYPGTKFYLMASIVNMDESGNEKDKQVFTKDYKSTVRLTISNLSSAYNALPNLRSDKVRLFETVTAGISTWKTGGSSSSELYNW